MRIQERGAVSVFKTKLFQDWQKKEDIPDKSLCAAVDEMSRGLIDATLGGGLVKKRIARAGAGKSSGFRTLLATNKNNKWFFVYGFAKNERDNIENQDLLALKRLAAVLLGMNPNAISKLLADNELKEICKNEK
ncbi:MAG: type II toxin-antitoxin system RelE/ParE family toxin [Sideroxydans sp.]|nr:type II toxin-antitoxin system RelE/ParE family toxin [Sideroxydans sp.]